ncbi:DUF1566 domain-containing protein [Shewanella baltica]|uniref:Lcl C-terminal domain-containing protein n=1 Tax=Shewanella baltica TaxID=62322 RepID=UPI003D06FBE5
MSILSNKDCFYIRRCFASDRILLLVICVMVMIFQTASGQETSERYLIHNDGTATDLLTGLQWSRCPYGSLYLADTNSCDLNYPKLTWNNLLNKVAIDTTAGYSDWRVPNKNEFLSIVDMMNPTSPISNFSAGIDNNVFPLGNIQVEFWTSTPKYGVSNLAYSIRPGHFIRYSSMGQTLGTFMVRGGVE